LVDCCVEIIEAKARVVAVSKPGSFERFDRRSFFGKGFSTSNRTCKGAMKTDSNTNADEDEFEQV